MNKKWSKVQILRFVVQLIFMASLVFSLGFIPGTKDVSTWLLPTVLLAGVFFCGWVCPFGAAQDWMSKLGRLLHLPQLRIPQAAQRYLQLTRYALYLDGGENVTCVIGERQAANACGAAVLAGRWLTVEMNTTEDAAVNRKYDEILCDLLPSAGLRRRAGAPTVEVFPADMSADSFLWEIRIPIE